MVGEKVGKYRVVSRLGRGGMGTVYKAVDETLGRDVAIKSLNADVADADLLKRFRAEAVTLARLNHPNIGILFELTEHEGQLLMIMEFVSGETVDRFSQRSGPLAVDHAARLCMQVLDALGHAHRAGVVHRDLKPANLMLTESGLVKVMDFGLARVMGTEHLTNDGFMVGTPAYMAPEQVLGREIDGRTDVYAMGVVLYRLLTGHLPFTAESGIAMVQKQISDEPTPARQMRADLPEVCEEILKRALAKSPDARFQSADDFRDALAPLAGAPAPSQTRMPVPLADPSSSAARPNLDAPTLPPTPTPLARPKLEPQPTEVLPRGATPKPSAPRPMRLGAIATGALVVLAGVPATIVLVRHNKPAEIVPQQPASISAPPVAASAPSAQAPAPPAEHAPAEAAPAPMPSAPLTSAAADVRKASSSARPKLPIVTFEQVKLLETDQGKSHDRDASLRLGADRVELLQGTTPFQSVPYGEVIGLFHSHSRDPRWTGPDGKPVPVAKAGGRLGFLKGADDWVTLRTKKTFVALRIDSTQLARLLSELRTRTGKPVVETR